MDDCIRIRSGDSWAEIALLGAEMRAWEVGGVPLLWTPDPSIWAETSPILFPVVGWTRNGEVRVGAKSYPLGLHGFARHSCFRVAERRDDYVSLVLDSNETTRRLYPFEFSFSVAYRLEGPSLSIRLSVFNRGHADMPYACGLHPGFRWPLVAEGQAEHRLIFDREEEPQVPEITAQGLFAASRRGVPLQGRSLALSPDLFEKEALCFLNVKSQGLTFASGDGALLRFDMEGFRHVALWSKPKAPFIAIELWTGHGDPQDYAGDLFAKPSMEILAAGIEAHHEARISFRQEA